MPHHVTSPQKSRDLFRLFVCCLFVLYFTLFRRLAGHAGGPSY